VHELRKDILLSRWIEVLSESKEPSEYRLPIGESPEEKKCVLCTGREAETPREIMSIKQGQYLILVVGQPIQF
jgi:hypothetical protein